MCAAGFQHVRELVGFPREAVGQRMRRGHERRGAERQREARGRRVHVVGRLSHVDVIVGMHPRVGAARLGEHLRRAIGEHLVRVHVVRRAGSRLVDVDDELIAKPAAQDLIGRLHNRGGDVAIEAAKRRVRFSRRFLDQDRGDDEIGRSAQSADRKVLGGASGLHAIVRVGRHLHLAQRIAFYPEAISH